MVPAESAVGFPIQAHEAEGRERHADLLERLASGRLLTGLAGICSTTGELPIELAVRVTHEQHPAIADDHRGGAEHARPGLDHHDRQAGFDPGHETPADVGRVREAQFP